MLLLGDVTTFLWIEMGGISLLVICQERCRVNLPMNGVKVQILSFA